MGAKIDFENDCRYITAWDADGRVLIRCGFDLTDCGDDEHLGKFIERHGGPAKTAEYLLLQYHGAA